MSGTSGTVAIPSDCRRDFYEGNPTDNKPIGPLRNTNELRITVDSDNPSVIATGATPAVQPKSVHRPGRDRV